MVHEVKSLSVPLNADSSDPNEKMKLRQAHLISGRGLIYWHTFLVAAAFVAALIIGINKYYLKIVTNQYYTYPDEWIPSVSATIGDRFPGRNLFQFFMAAAAIPRMLLLFTTWHVYRLAFLSLPSSTDRFRNSFVLTFASCFGLLRIFAAGAWIYVPSGDWNLFHDATMIIYLLFTLLYHGGLVLVKSKLAKEGGRRWQSLSNFMSKLLFLATIPITISMVYYFIQHKAKFVPGAYSRYSAIEWTLLALDIGWDFFAGHDLLRQVSLSIVLPTAPVVNSVPTKSTIPSNLLATSPSHSLASIIRGASHICDIYASFLFWSLWSPFLQMLWYFPLWALGFSGYEVGGLIIFSLCLLGVQWCREFAYKWRTMLMIAAVIIGIGAASNWQLVDSVPLTNLSPACRIVSAWIGLTLAAASQFSELYMSKDPKSFINSCLAGLLLQMIVRIAFVAHIPFWPIVLGTNEGKVSLGMWISVAILILRHLIQSSLSPNPCLVNKQYTQSCLRSGIRMGALLFSINEFLIEPSLLSHWTVTGYPRSILSSLLGHLPPILLSIFVYSVGLPFVNHRYTLILGCIAAILFSEFSMRDYSNLGYFVGLFLQTIILSQWNLAYEEFSNAPPGRSLLAMLLTFILLSIGQIYTVAFAFVPYGWYLRERSSIIFGIGMIALLLNPKKTRPISTTKFSVHRKDGLILLVLLLCALSYRLSKPYYKLVDNELNLLDYQGAPNNIQTIITDSLQGLPVVRVATTAIHFGIDDELYSNDGRVRDVVKSMDLDFLGLVESDTMRSVMGHRDIIQKLGESLNYYVDYGPATSKATWGCALVSKWPIVNSTHHILPSPDGEIACAIYATVRLYNDNLLDVLISHNGQEEDVIGRRLQTLELARLAGEARNPLVFSGYIVAKPKSTNYHYLFSQQYPKDDLQFDWAALNATQGTLIDIKPDEGDRWCLYVGYRGPGVIRVGYARLHHDGITDTEFQIGSFAILPKPTVELPFYKIQENVKRVIDYIGESRMELVHTESSTVGNYWKKWKFPSSPVCSSPFYQPRPGKSCGHRYHTVVNFWV